MSKKSKIKCKDFLKEMEKNEEKAKTEVAEYYANGCLANVTHSSEKTPLASLVARAKQASAPQTPT